MKIFEEYRRPSKKVGRRRPIKKTRSRREVLDSLHPMAYSLLAVKSQEARPNKWVSDSFEMLNNKPERLSEKWVARINSWTEDIIKASMLDDPDVDVGDRRSFGPMLIHKIIPPNDRTEYPMPAIMCLDERGWKWYFKTTKAFSFKQGQSISFTATVSSHKEGITFLRRPSKIEVSGKIFGDIFNNSDS